MVAMHVRHDALARAATHRQVRRIAPASPDVADETVFAPWPGSSRTTDGPGRPGAATVLRLQQTVGNQAVQRLLQVQRDDDLIPSVTVGDWKVEPPKPTTETDTTYDTDEEKRRAEQKAADERGESPKPEWWKPKPHGKPTDPKDWDDLNKWRGKEKPSGGGADFGPLPPAEEQQPGDYPLTPAIEPEDAAYA